MAYAKLNVEKPYARCIGNRKASFYQQGRYYDRAGKFIEAAPTEFVKGLGKLDDEPESADSVFNRAAQMTGGEFDVSESSAEPKSIVDAARENAQALAAEEFDN